MRVLYRGNFGPQFSTESHVAASLESLGHEVIRSQEDEMPWAETVRQSESAHMFLWTSTFSLAHIWDQVEAHDSVKILNEVLPTASMHLDLFWSIGREEQVRTEPWFRLRHVFTADGGHDDEWVKEGVNHHWLPPGVFHAEAYDGHSRREYMSDVAFVGSWRHYGHEEHWPERKKMLDTLRRKFGRRFVCWPKQQAIRGTDLTDLYASVKVVVGDSCLAGKVPGYWSDRVPETMGRGGFLIHPYVDGILNTHPDLVTYTPGDMSELVDKVSYFLANAEDRELNRKQNAEYTRTHHTYRNRLQAVLDIVL